MRCLSGSTGLSHLVTGLTDGTAYTFTVTATNAAGTSLPSAPSNSVTPAPTAPNAPTNVKAAAGDSQASVSFTAPAANGSPITAYTVTSTPGGVIATGTSSPIVITGLTNGTTYTFTVTATNAIGTSDPSTPSNSIIVMLIPQAYYIHTDYLDTPRLITDTGGNVVWEWQNTDPFGNNVPNENPNGAGQFGFNLRFPGQYFDKETNTHYNFHRDYDPSTGRYIESDPIGLLGGINTYTYVTGDPLSHIDPFGLLSPPEVGVGVILGTGYAIYQIIQSYKEGQYRACKRREILKREMAYQALQDKVMALAPLTPAENFASEYLTGQREIDQLEGMHLGLDFGASAIQDALGVGKGIIAGEALKAVREVVRNAFAERLGEASNGAVNSPVEPTRDFHLAMPCECKDD